MVEEWEVWGEPSILDPAAGRLVYAEALSLLSHCGLTGGDLFAVRVAGTPIQSHGEGSARLNQVPVARIFDTFNIAELSAPLSACVMVTVPANELIRTLTTEHAEAD